jgi:hypothetical protein
VAGIGRGLLVPGARPNEALLALLIGIMLARPVLQGRFRPRLSLRRDPVALALALMAVTNSFVPLTWMAVRGKTITGDDVLYAVVLWKYLALYLVVRAMVRTAAEARRCLWVLLASASIVSVIAILQSLNLFGVPGLLAGWYAPEGNVAALSGNRGSSTLASSFATADVMLLCVGVLVGLATRGIGRSRVLAGFAALALLGVFASGQFSAVIGLLVALAALFVVSRRRRVFLAILPVVAVAPVLLRPVIERRLQGFGTVSGWPESWIGRYNNLRGYFWPELSSDNNFLLGVRPNSRVPGSRDAGIDWVWIESGYMWLLWGGGLPLLLAYFGFTAVVFARSWRSARDDDSVYGAVAVALFSGMCVFTVLMLLDPHITYRGAADTFFALLAILATSPFLIRSGVSLPLPREAADAAVPPPEVTPPSMQTQMTSTGGAR